MASSGARESKEYAVRVEVEERGSGEVDHEPAMTRTDRRPDHLPEQFLVAYVEIAYERDVRTVKIERLDIDRAFPRPHVCAMVSPKPSGLVSLVHLRVSGGGGAGLESQTLATKTPRAQTWSIALGGQQAAAAES